jgi:ribokinase
VAASVVLSSASATIVQLQQPSVAALAAACCARDAGHLVVLDGAPAGDRRDALLDAADVVRADDREAAMLTSCDLGTADDAVQAGQRLLRRHRLSLVALAAGDAGNVFVWPDGHEVLPLLDTEVVDTTGAGDAFTAALTTVLCRGGGPREAARLAVAAAAATVGHPGGRPNLTRQRLDQYLTGLDQRAPR